MKQLTKNKWFGPARATRGGVWPTSWQGFVVSLLFIALFVGDIVFFNKGDGALWGGFTLGALFVCIVYISGGRPNNNTFN
ncbi:MAG: hypothetical protein ABI354_03335 [Candidatus Saccharimonadales bacterium]